MYLHVLILSSLLWLTYDHRLSLHSFGLGGDREPLFQKKRTASVQGIKGRWTQQVPSTYWNLRTKSHDTRHRTSGSSNLSIHRHESLKTIKPLKSSPYLIIYPSHHKELRGLDLQFHATYKIMDIFALRPHYSQEESYGCPFDRTGETFGLYKVRGKVFFVFN
jgi:hypothetical protein